MNMFRVSRRAFVKTCAAMMALPVLKQLTAQRTQRTYKNPLPVVVGDPYILKAPDGTYYMYDTGAGGVWNGVDDATMSFPVHLSKNLIDWTPIGLTHKRDPAASWGTEFFWAPEVYFRNGKYIMVYSAQWRNNPTHEDESFRIGIAVSDSPRGPFHDVKNEPLFDPGWPVIDADVLFDEDGRCFMYFSRCCYKHPVDSELSELVKKNGWFQTVEESWIYGIEIKPDFSGVIGEPVLILRPSVKLDEPNTAWENVSVMTREVNRRWTEGPTTFKHNGIYFVMYSANSVFGDNYALGYATSRSPLGPYLKAANNPVARKNTDRGGEVTTTAHNCIAMSPDGSEMFCVYGARTKATGKERVLFVNRMEVQKDGTLVVYPPDTVTEHPMPSGSA